MKQDSQLQAQITSMTNNFFITPLGSYSSRQLAIQTHNIQWPVADMFRFLDVQKQDKISPARDTNVKSIQDTSF